MSMYGHVGSHKTLTDVPVYYITLLKATIKIYRQTDFRRKQLDDTITCKVRIYGQKCCKL